MKGVSSNCWHTHPRRYLRLVSGLTSAAGKYLCSRRIPSIQAVRAPPLARARPLVYPRRVPTPRLLKVACPQCGAGLRIEAEQQVVTCRYCNLSSFVHLPHRPATQVPTEGYGNIHVSEE